MRACSLMSSGRTPPPGGVLIMLDPDYISVQVTLRYK